MKKKVIIFLVICFCFLVGCGNKEQVNSQNGKQTENLVEPEGETGVGEGYVEQTTESEDSNVELNFSEENLSLMQKVLLNRVEFLGQVFENNETQFVKYTLETYEDLLHYENQDCFLVVDLDHDMQLEVCIIYGSYVLILHEMDNEIYGYIWNYRSFEPVYQDGTFESSGGANLVCFNGNVKFTKTGFSRTIITSIKWKYTSGECSTEHYYKNGEPDTKTSIEITKEEYDEIMSNYSKEEVMSYDFTIENILKYVD